MKYKIMLIVAVLIGTCGQIAMKLGVNSVGGLDSFESKAEMLFAVFTSPYILAGLVCSGVGMLLWLTVISHLELSFAYPFMALSYIIILLFGWIELKENVNGLRVAGIAFIMSGVIVMSRTGGEEH